MEQVTTSITGNPVKMVGRERYKILREKKRAVQIDDFKYMFPWALDNDPSSFNEQQIKELENESNFLQQRLNDIKNRR